MPSFINRVRFIGYTPMPNVDEQEYKDYINHICTMPFSQFRSQLALGTLPEGIVFAICGFYPGRVIGHGLSQQVERYYGAMMT